MFIKCRKSIIRLFLLLALCLNYGLKVYAQSENKITLRVTNVTLDQALQDIVKQVPSLSVVYSDVDINKGILVSVKVENEDIEVALNRILEHTNLSFSLYDKYLVLSKRINLNQNPINQKETTFKGVVIDEDGESLIGASILVKGKQTGTITGVNGDFIIQAHKGDVLQVSYIGFNTKEVKVANKTNLKIILEQDNKLLDEVVVTALGIKREVKSLSYNVQEIKSSGVNKVKDASFVNSLAGKIAGVTINQSSTGVGGSTRVVMRGTKSLFGDNNALYVLDGIPMPGLRTKQSDNYYESTEISDSDGISNINPDDIESMSVLTGASSAALYGNRGANGVILITTKKGIVGKPKVSYNHSTSFMNPFVTPDFQNTYGRKEGEFKSWGDKLANKSSYDPLDFYQTGFNVMNSVGVSTGSDTNKSYISVGSVNSKGIVPNNKYNRYNLTLRNSAELIKDVLELDMSLYYIHQNNQNGIGQGMYYNPIVPVYLFPPSDDINKYVVYERYNEERKFKTQYWPYGNQSLAMQNPYWIINRNKFNTKRNRYILSGALKWNVTDWMNIIGRVRLDRSNSDFERKLYASTDGLFAKPKGNWMNQTETNEANYLDFLVNIDKKIGEDFRVMANVGGSFYDEKYKMDGIEGELLKVPNFFHPSNMAQTETNNSRAKLHTQTQSFYGKAEVSFRNFIYLDATGRIDYFSTLLGTDKKYVVYPSVGLSVVLSDIIPISKDILSFWKLRTSYAQVGNPPSPYLTYPSVPLEGGNATAGTFTAATHLKPEMTKSFELGIDMSFFNGMVNFSGTYYNSNTYNQLFRYKLPPSTGYSYSFENAGKVNNWGLELTLGFNNKFGPVEWNSNLIYTLNRNKIKELLPDYITDRQTGAVVKAPAEFEVAGAESYRMILKKGGTMSDIYASKLRQDYKGYILSNNGVEPDANNFIKVGQAAPLYNLGFRNSVSYRGFELDFLIDARVGGEVVSATQAMMDQFGVSKTSAQARDNGGVKVNNGLLNAESYYNVVAGGKTGLLAHYTYSATNVRLREVSLTYKVPSSLFNNKVNVAISLTGRNLLMFYNKAPFDPELTANTGTYYQGFDFFMPPSLRNLGFGIKVNF